MKIRWNAIAPAQGIEQIVGNPATEVSGIAFDSRKVEPGFIFVAQAGSHTDGHVIAAIGKGASVVVCEQLPAACDSHVLYVKVSRADEILGQLAAAWYNHPSAMVKVVGVTGTNGKTSIATLLYNLFTRLGYKTGLISTISTYDGFHTEVATHTTPDALKIQHLLSRMAEAGCDYCFMEVSSHALVQRRVAGIEFTGGIFTNLTHDHLDYHKSFAEYLKAKKGFFDQLGSNAFALTNLDDKNGMVMVRTVKPVYTAFPLATWLAFAAR